MPASVSWLFRLDSVVITITKKGAAYHVETTHSKQGEWKHFVASSLFLLLVRDTKSLWDGERLKLLILLYILSTHD